MNAVNAIVPLRPTPEMVEHLRVHSDAGYPADGYAAAIAAAPFAGRLPWAKLEVAARARFEACMKNCGAVLLWDAMKPETVAQNLDEMRAAFGAVGILVEKRPGQPTSVVKECLTTAADCKRAALRAGQNEEGR
jgi:hypothetical protein